MRAEWLSTDAGMSGAGVEGSKGGGGARAVIGMGGGGGGGGPASQHNLFVKLISHASKQLYIFFQSSIGE